MSKIDINKSVETENADVVQANAIIPEEEKTYVEPEPSKGKRFDSVDDFLQDICTPEEVAKIKELAVTQTVGHALTAMRINAGISQKMMAAALGVSQPRISAIETAPNSKASWKVIQRYVEVTKCSFKAVLEDGSVVCFSRPSKKSSARCA